MQRLSFGLDVVGAGLRDRKWAPGLPGLESSLASHAGSRLGNHSEPGPADRSAALGADAVRAVAQAVEGTGQSLRPLGEQLLRREVLLAGLGGLDPIHRIPGGLVGPGDGFLLLRVCCRAQLPQAVRSHSELALQRLLDLVRVHDRSPPRSKGLVAAGTTRKRRATFVCKPYRVVSTGGAPYFGCSSAMAA